MVRKLLARPQVRFAADAVVGLAVFSGLTVALLGPSAAAGLVASGVHSSVGVSIMPMLTSQAAGAMARANDAHLILLVLAVVFSTMFALNLAFVRHLTNSYVAARAQSRPHNHENAPLPVDLSNGASDE